MFKKIKFLALVAVAICSCSFASCSEVKYDPEGIKQVVEKKSSEITSADIDYLLDQAEAFAKLAAKSGNAEEYMKSVDKKEAGTIIALAFTLQSLQESDKMSEKQLKRFAKLSKMDKE